MPQSSWILTVAFSVVVALGLPVRSSAGEVAAPLAGEAFAALGGDSRPGAAAQPNTADVEVDADAVADAVAEVALVAKPRIIDVIANPPTSRVHHTADRDQLLAEFPDDLVESLWLQDWQDIERAYQFGRLVDIASDPVGRGIVLRLEGGSKIGELDNDAYLQTLMCRLAKPAAGLLYRIASRLRLVEGQAFEPLEITSLVRTWDYQLRLADVNPNADRSREGVPPTHVLGLAFDIARSRMGEERQHRIELLLDQLAMDGQLAYYKEGSSNGLAHYHVIALPSAEFTLMQEYDRGTVTAAAQVGAQGRHRVLPEPPCVTFGYSLEPFSAICSCELPAELIAAATTTAMAPTSN